MPEGQTKTPEQATAAFVLSLMAGLWMLAAESMMGGFGWGGMMRGWMWGHGGIGGLGVLQPWFAGVAGGLVLVGAVMLYTKPEQRQRWGVVILVVSALDFVFGMMGLLAGTLGVIGGVLALS